MSFGHEQLAIRFARNRPSTPWWESIPMPIAIPTPRRTEPNTPLQPTRVAQANG